MALMSVVSGRFRWLLRRHRNPLEVPGVHK